MVRFRRATSDVETCLGVGLAIDPVLLDPDALGRAIAALGAVRRGVVNLGEPLPGLADCRADAVLLLA